MIAEASIHSPRRAEMTEATIKSMTMKLLNCSHSSCRKPGRGASASWFSP